MLSQFRSTSPLALVIDSHAAVGAVVVRMLANAGIDSVVAHGSREAERILGERGGDLWLVVAEVDGSRDCCAALLRRLRHERPELGLICLTPHACPLSAPLAELGLTRLTKPFTASDLRDAVTRLIAA